LNDPKGVKSKREVPLTSKTAALLLEYRKLLVDDRPGAWLFPSENPDPNSASNARASRLFVSSSGCPKR
jgi:hypothetical protein